MKLFLGLATVVVLLAGLGGCASHSEINPVLDPDALFKVIQENPERFMAALQDASEIAERLSQERTMEALFEAPLTAKMQDWRAIDGDVDAPITIFMYTDFQCPYCARGYQTMQQVKALYGAKVRFVLKHLPLDFHDSAMSAATIFEAINMQSSIEAYQWHNIVFENQAGLNTPDYGVSWMLEMAGAVGADVDRVMSDMGSKSIEARIAADLDEAARLNFSGTPGFLINGIPLNGAYPIDAFASIIDRHLSNID
ncbi:MAG: DsbA family protein [SAR86 cluster bacterium]